LQPALLLRELACHVGLHRVICHPAEMASHISGMTGGGSSDIEMLRTVSATTAVITSMLLQTVSRPLLFIHLTQSETLCLQCFDAVGWAAGRASGL